MKYIELLKLVTITGGKTPTDKSLRESEIPIIFEQHLDNSILKVYQNGFTSYTAINGNKKHTTVFSLNKVKWTYRFADDSVVTIPEAEYVHFDAEIVLTTYGEERLAHNNDSREEIRGGRKEKIQKKFTSAVPDFSDAVIRRLDADSPLELALEKLTKKQRKVIYLYFFEEMNQREIAEFLGMSRSAVQSHLEDAKKKLRKYL